MQEWPIIYSCIALMGIMFVWNLIRKQKVVVLDRKEFEKQQNAIKVKESSKNKSDNKPKKKDIQPK